MSAYALERAAIMICKLSGGKTTQGALGGIQTPKKAPKITLRHSRAESLIGVPLGGDFCEMTLRSLGCETLLDKAPGSADPSWTITPPGHRPDLEREADLIEELARFYGVDRLPEKLPAITRRMDSAGEDEPKHKFLTRVKNWACGLGLNEVINYSFVGHKDLDLLGFPAKGRISILNPLSAEQDVLRTALAPGLLNSLRHNLAQGSTGLRLFEIAGAFTADPASETGALENTRLGLLLYGDRYGSSWPHRVEDAGYLDLKGFVEHFIAWLDLPEAVYSQGDLPPFSPTVSIIVQGVHVGSLGRVKPEIADIYHARREVWMAELDLDALLQQHRAVKLRFQSLPIYPPVRRDITVITPPGRESRDILQGIYASKPAHLENAYMVDLFQKDGARERNLTFRLVFRHGERTLQDAEVDKLRDKIASFLVQSLGVKI
jgi:phenylalanyl-tRNA synthetase beta chain